MVKSTRLNKVIRLIPWLTTLATLGCILDGPINEVTPTELIFTVDQNTKAVGEDFSFSYSARGTALFRVVVEYGDGTLHSDSTFFGAFQSARMEGTVDHAYDAAGSYTVIAFVEDLAVGADSAQLVVQVGN